MYEGPDAKKFLRTLNAAYEPPGRRAIAGRLLDETYDKIKARSDAVLSTLEWINVSTDESTNINANRIANISIHSEYGTLHYVSDDVKAQRMTAPATATWLREHLLSLSNHRLDRINSIASDTCSTMRRMWLEVEEFEDLKHCFFIPCDSHGIQLLVKDIFTLLPGFNDVLQKAQTIVKSFRLAPLQYSRLRELQVENYGHHQSLVLSVMTRWGTQYRLVESLINSKDAVRSYAINFRTLPPSQRLKRAAMDAIMDRHLWVRLEALRELLKPIDERLRMSESGKSHLGHVLDRWGEILKHLRMQSIEHEALHAFVSDGAFSERYNKQVLPIHIVAYYLVPHTTLNDIRNKVGPIPIGFENKITAFFHRYCSSEDNEQLIMREFVRFRDQQSPFEPSRQCWVERDDPYHFWHAAMPLARNLAPLAVRIFSAPANSVASERAFSVQNIIHNKTRNRLRPQQVDKLSFVYTNARILDQHDIPEPPAAIPTAAPEDDFGSKLLDKLTPVEQVRLEDILMDLDVEDDLAGLDDEMDVFNDESDEESVDVEF